MAEAPSEFDRQNLEMAEAMAADAEVRSATREWFDRTAPYQYSYHFKWLGRPIIQYPQDVMALQELIWETKPDLIIETGVAHGGSLVLSASILELLGGDGVALGIDIDIRAHNRQAIESHPLSGRIRMIEGSSIAPDVVRQVRDHAKERARVMVILDSSHSHDHVSEELDAYAPLVTVGNYLAVLDTIVEQMPVEAFPNRPWGRGNNPATAVEAFLAKSDDFVVDDSIDNRLLISVAPGGYLKRIKSSD